MSGSSVYTVKAVFPTIQGEGYHAGTPAVFVRFAGCNLWTGIESRRGADSRRNGATCPLFCDTDFRGGDHLDAADVVDRVRDGYPDPRLIVLTGGEPLLQVDQDLVDVLLAAFQRSIVAFETNGTVRARFAKRSRVWVTMSPKMTPDDVRLGVEVDELKVVFPAYDPLQWSKFPTRHRFVSPQADPTTGRLSGVEAEAARFVQEHQDWRLSVQTHKVLGIP